MNNSLKSSRNESIDSVAGLMIIYMVFTHVMQGFGQTHVECYKILERFLYFFMPWFFFKAGMFFRITDNRTFVKKKRKEIIAALFDILVNWTFSVFDFYCAS